MAIAHNLPLPIESSPLYNADLAPAATSVAHWGTSQLCRAVGIDVGEHSYLHAGRQPDPGRDELEAGSRDRIFGNTIVLFRCS